MLKRQLQQIKLGIQFEHRFLRKREGAQQSSAKLARSVSTASIAAGTILTCNLWNYDDLSMQICTGVYKILKAPCAFKLTPHKSCSSREQWIEAKSYNNRSC